MDELVQWNVYSNLLQMLKYREVTVTSEHLDVDSLMQKLSYYYFVTITGTRDSSDPREHWITVILLAPDSNYSTKSGDFKRLLSKVKIVEKDTNNLIFVASAPASAPELPLTKHIEKKIAAYRARHPNVYVETRGYSIFQIEVPKHVSVPLHIVAPKEEVDAFCKQYCVSRERFPRITLDDPMAVWLGLRRGDVVKILRVSETAGIAPVYRLCE